MTDSPTAPDTPRIKFARRWRWLAAGVLAVAVVSILASGYMIEITNKDRFCVKCHAMIPFRSAWKKSLHGGVNPKGFAAQCVDCHLPHGDFFQYLSAKAVTGTGDVIQNIILDLEEFDWIGNAERRREKFTYDSACRHCHVELIPEGVKPGAILAHRTYLLNRTEKRCAACHPNVGHHEMIEEVVRHFKKG